MGDENVAGLVEGIIFFGGLEYGLFLPSLSGMFGARFSSGYEFAVGPNFLSLGGAGLVIGIGKTIQAGNLNIPINLAWVPSTQRQIMIIMKMEFIKENETVRVGNRFTFNNWI